MKPATKPTPTLGFESTWRLIGSGPDKRDVIDLDVAQQEAQRSAQGFSPEHYPVESANKLVGEEFINAFRSVAECNGIAFVADDAKPVDFTVSIHVAGRLQGRQAQSWIWVVTNSKTHDRSFMRKYSEMKRDAQETVRSVCTTVWGQVDPNRLPGKGGRIQ